MAEGRSKKDFLEFLDWTGNKGLLPLNTAQARKAVANKVLAALESDELEDVTSLDIDNVMVRFTNKFGKRYTPESLRTYQSRFESSIADFKAYCADPVGFRPSGRSTNRNKNGDDGNDKPKVAKAPKRLSIHKSQPTPQQNTAHEPTGVPSGNIVPVQIRADLTVKIGPVPFDLTKSEASRIANVILALASADA
jgi:hypothetical protein